jgi:hypothetical protein
MKVAELIAALREMPPQAEVMVEWGGTLATGVALVAGLHREPDPGESGERRREAGTVYIDY